MRKLLRYSTLPRRATRLSRQECNHLLLPSLSHLLLRAMTYPARSVIHIKTIDEAVNLTIWPVDLCAMYFGEHEWQWLYPCIISLALWNKIFTKVICCFIMIGETRLLIPVSILIVVDWEVLLPSRYRKKWHQKKIQNGRQFHHKYDKKSNREEFYKD